MSDPTIRWAATTPAPRRVLVVGFARTGQAVAKVASGVGATVHVIDDRSMLDGGAAKDIGVELELAVEPTRIEELVRWADLVVVSPGVSPSHPVFNLARASSTEVIAEIELAARLDGPPIAAITGTNGKTTVTTLVAAMLANAGRSVRAAGNIGYPLVEAVTEPGIDLVVAEVSSFQLAMTSTFSPVVGAWLNLAEDHLDWHASLDEYASAKEQIWAHQSTNDVVVANCADAAVIERARRARGRLVTFGRESGDFHLDGDAFVGPDRTQYACMGDLRRTMPHDVDNALAAIAVASVLGARPQDCARALRNQPDLAHRIEHVATYRGVDFFDDSKATTPSAVIAALAGFSSVVLIAGGRNKGLDLGVIADAVRARDGAGRDGAGSEPERSSLRAVVAIGDAATEIEQAFKGSWTVVRASSMDRAVAEALNLAVEGDAVLLSPGCASFDWYRSYEERGQDYVRAIKDLQAEGLLAPGIETHGLDTLGVLDT